MNDEEKSKEDENSSPNPECGVQIETSNDPDEPSRLEKNGRRRRPRNVSQDRQQSSSSDCSFHEANDNNEASGDEAIKR